MSPNGNGGWFKSMLRAHLDEDIRTRGIEWLNVFCRGQCIAEDCGSGVCRGNDFVWMCVWFESRA